MSVMLQATSLPETPSSPMITDSIASIDPFAVGTRLKRARKGAGFTQAQAAAALNLARTTLTAIESGARRPRPAELVRLAQLYRHSVGDLLRAVAQPPSIGFDTYFFPAGTAAGLGNEPAFTADVQRFERFCLWYVELEERLNAPLPRRYPVPYDVSGPSLEQSAEDVAAAERNRLGLGDGPIGDIYGLLETDVGLRVFAFTFEASSVAGMYVATDAFGGCVGINARHSEARRRWTLAHEYAHFLTHRQKAEVSVLSSRKRLPRDERWADTFARFFLMPGVGLGRRLDAMERAKNDKATPADAMILAHLYRVSFQAMVLRLEEIGRIPQGSWKTLELQGFRPDQAKRYVPMSPVDRDPTLPRRYELLAAKAFAAEMLTEGELARRLDTDRVSARARVEELTREEREDDGEMRQMNLDLTSAFAGASSR